MDKRTFKSLVEVFEIACLRHVADTHCEAKSDGFTEVWYEFVDGPAFKVAYDAEMEPFSMQVCGTRMVVYPK